MAKEVRLPQLGQTMEEGTIVNCLVNVGDEVAKGDVIFEVETDKATLEMESPGEGFVKHILVPDNIPEMPGFDIRFKMLQSLSGFSGPVMKLSLEQVK